jgi:ubiquinone/menaquinone biosynthesis C-methylase UbiE
LGRERTGIGPGAHVLEVGCGFGLETLRLAHLALAGGFVAGCDLSSDFLAEARRRADAAGVNIAFQQARVETLPYPDQSFEIVWADAYSSVFPAYDKLLQRCEGCSVA